MSSKEKVVRFCVITCFASADELKKSACCVWRRLQGKGIAISEWTKSCFQNSDALVIPLILCHKRDDLKKLGVFCPYEFILELKDLLPGVNESGEKEFDADDVLKERLMLLSTIYRDRKQKDFTHGMEHWFAGLFRLYLMLDATTHGTSQFVDLDLVAKKDCEDPILKAIVSPALDNAKDEIGLLARRLRDRFLGGSDPNVDAFLAYKEFLEDLYQSRFKAMKEAIREKTLGKIQKIYCDAEVDKQGVPMSHLKRLPLAYGDRAKYITPTGKLNLLLVDDDIERSPLGNLGEEKGRKKFRDTISQDDWRLLRNIFNVQKLPILPDSDACQLAFGLFRRLQQQGMTYDLILIDLCLGGQQFNADPDGYAVIRLAKIFFPGTPIVVYSKFRDMEHISRAFFSGARWFLVKGEEAKLPRHVLKMIKQVGWHREWRSVETGVLSPRFAFAKSDEFSHKFERTPEWKYLTYKCLEYLPGQLITVQKMGGGISSAVTFKAVKGPVIGRETLQTPNIIKIDSSYNTMMEFERYFRMIRPYMANEAGRIEKPERVLNREFSAIVYTFAGKQDAAHELRAMSEMVESDMVSKTTCDFEKYRYALNCVFDEILPKIHRVSPALEVGRAELAHVGPSFPADAFVDTHETVGYSSFPNPYFNECDPKKFWKSYVMRLPPWGRSTLNSLNEIQLQVKVDLGSGQGDDDKARETVDVSFLKNRLAFHSAMLDPKNKGRYLVEAYAEDMKLVWLDGDASDFIARFRKHIRPGDALWLGGFKMPEDGRTEWLESALSSWGKPGHEDHWESFVEWKCAFDSSACSKKTGKSMPAAKRMRALKGYADLEDKILHIAKEVESHAIDWGCRCPVGIVHGDLNLANVMLESRLHAPKEGDPDRKSTISDVWFIDFARTRRDIIAHDFNVFFTSVLSALFHTDLLADETYRVTLMKHFKKLVAEAVSSKARSLSAIPDAFKDDERLSFVYKMLRRGREAALKAGVSQNMYTLTTALACLYTMKIFLNNRPKKLHDQTHPIIKAAGFFAAAQICYDLLPEEMRKVGDAAGNSAKKVN